MGADRKEAGCKSREAVPREMAQPSEARHQGSHACTFPLLLLSIIDQVSSFHEL